MPAGCPTASPLCSRRSAPFPGRCAEGRGRRAQSGRARAPWRVAAPRALGSAEGTHPQNTLPRGALVPAPARSPQPCPGLLGKGVRAPSLAVVGAGGAARGEVLAELIPAPRRLNFQSRGVPAKPQALPRGGTARRGGEGEKSAAAACHGPRRALPLGEAEGEAGAKFLGKSTRCVPNGSYLPKTV